MKVLLILDNLSRDSGVSSIVMNLYRNIENVSFDFLIFKNSDDSYLEEVLANDSQVFCLPYLLSIKTFYVAKKEAKAFFKERTKEYDVIHLHSPTINEFTLRYAKKYGAKNCIVHSHSSMTSNNTVKRVLNYLLTYRIMKYANHFWTCSDVAADFLFGKEFTSCNRVEMVHNAICPEKYYFDNNLRFDVRNQMGIDEATVFAHISNFSAIKNLLFLIPVISELSSRNCKFLFVGEGPTKQKFESELRANDLLDFCIFVGKQKDVSKFLQISDALLLPSLKEGLPVTVIEAQASGLPCFVTETITRECDLGGVTYLPLITNNWTTALERFRPLDEVIRKQNSISFEETNFNIYKEAKRVEKLYLSIGDNNE